ncbi:hypothetical protein IWX90DRAFT_40268 [Phyllosticta citrichinensis]|uniref:Uncharacterized protein n=1 Tax=Phyllosticta citrichinensis TaxID=1130410 RepID=A0ABR1Y8C8_9PEZI
MLVDFPPLSPRRRASWTSCMYTHTARFATSKDSLAGNIPSPDQSYRFHAIRSDLRARLRRVRCSRLASQLSGRAKSQLPTFIKGMSRYVTGPSPESAAGSRGALQPGVRLGSTPTTHQHHQHRHLRNSGSASPCRSSHQRGPRPVASLPSTSLLRPGGGARCLPSVRPSGQHLFSSCDGAEILSLISDVEARCLTARIRFGQDAPLHRSQSHMAQAPMT